MLFGPKIQRDPGSNLSSGIVLLFKNKTHVELIMITFIINTVYYLDSYLSIRVVMDELFTDLYFVKVFKIIPIFI